MKKLLGILVLGLFLITPSQADDIRDFQIEGMSIGDSLLDYFSEGLIKENIADEEYKSKKFYDVNIYDPDTFNTYLGVQIAIKTNDIKYIMHGIDGLLSYKNNIEQCYKKRKKIIKELLTIFNNAKKSDRGKIQHPQDPDSFTTDTFLTLDSGHKVVISCYDWSKNLESEGYYDQLRISLWTKELNDWLVR